MNHMFFDLLDDHVIVYLDDILIFSRTKEERLTRFLIALISLN